MKLPDIFRLEGTIIFAIWWKILLFILYTVVLLCLQNFVPGWQINFPLTLIPVLGVVTGLLLVFRTNTAYDRFYEGRNIWSKISLNIRIVTRSIWISVKESNVEDLVEKTSAINLLVAFAYATKNHLREVYSFEEKKIESLVSHLPKLSSPSYLDGKDYFNSSGESPRIPPTNIPMELVYYIHSYLRKLKETGKAEDGTISGMVTAINNLVECLCGLERILRTPIPRAYSVHLHHATWIFLLSLPYQLIGVLNWFTIPAVGLSTFALLGILAIGKEIENPFGYDDNDLPLDDFCDTIYMESWRVTGGKMSLPEMWLYSPANRPFQPISPLPASLLRTMDLNNVRKMLATRAEMRISKVTQTPGELKDAGDFKFVSVPPIITTLRVFRTMKPRKFIIGENDMKEN